MFTLNLWKTGTATLLALSLTSSAVFPLVVSVPAFAQSRYPRSEYYNQSIPSGTVIRVQYDKDKILLMPNETVPLTLTVAQDVRGNNGRILIPVGSEIKGELKPAYRGSQFVAKELAWSSNGQLKRYSINATSNIVTRTEDVKKGANTRSILTGTAVGAGAAAAIAALTGDHAIATEELLGGAGLGTIAGFFLGRKKVTMISVYPEQDLAVRLRSDLALR